jgi:phosphoribosylglycinamide formyltransferase 1
VAARLKLGVLISGRGSNLEALLRAAAAPAYPAEVAIAIANRAEAPGLAHAEKAGVPALTIEHKRYSDRPAFEAELDQALRAAGVELVCLAGFMRVLTADFVTRWRDRLINIHPSLLPAFPGLDTHARALQAGVRFAGCTVHYVRPELDHGPIIVQASVPVRPDDDAASLAARVLAAEHRAYPLAVRLIGEGKVELRGERVRIAGATAPHPTLLNPTEG